MRLLIDVSSIAKTALYQGEDKEFGKKIEFNGKNVQVNGWQHGYERFNGYLLHVLEQFSLQPHQLIFVTEGRGAKARRVAMYDLYKANRDEKPQELNDQFNTLVGNITKDWRSIGSHFVTQEGVEADDVIAYLAQNLAGDVLILSNDGDMSALLTPTVRLIKDGQLITENPLGPFNIKFIPLYKAIVGDTSDNIKGAFKFGEKAWLDLLVWAGEPGLAALEGMIKRRKLHDLVEDVKDFKPLQRIVDSADAVYKCYEVAKLHPEWVNTMRLPLQWKAGMVKGRDQLGDQRLAPYSQQIRLVTADNYDKALEFLKVQAKRSPIFALDLETSTPDKSDEWLLTRNAADKVDVYGSAITGMGLTFGPNSQYTFYFSVDHTEANNISLTQLRQVVEALPAEGDVHLVVQNASFELPICYEAFGDDLRNNDWHGFLPNVVDTKHMASYVDENQSLGLKKLSAFYLDYDQETYEHVTTMVGAPGTMWGGRITASVVETVTDENGDTVLDENGAAVTRVIQETRRFKMNELSAQHVLSYGADDTICTAALYHFFKIVMEVEKTWDAFMQVEQLPAYVTALAFVQGTKFDLMAMNKMKAEDDATWKEHAEVLRQFLIDIKWPGTVCPVYSGELTPADVKEIVKIVTGQELKTMVRKIDKLAKLIEVEIDSPYAEVLARYIADGDLGAINAMVAKLFVGAAELDTDSPKQMKEFLYDYLGLPVRIVGSSTKLERQNKPELAAAVSRYKKIWAGSLSEPPLTPTELELLKQKAKTNEIAIAFALVMDQDNPHIHILEHIQKMKKCETRRKLYYEPYANLQHWKDGKIHAQVNQNGTITRRYSSSDPNLQQLPKKGEGVKFRRCFLPHHKDAVICSVDFSGQELRQGAGQSMDPGMLACYVGDNLKDMHSMTAAGAMEKKWGRTKLNELISQFGQEGDDDYKLFLRLRKSDNKAVAKMADDLRKNAKNVNFGAQYDAQAPKLAETLIIPVADAEAFLQAKFAMFPRFEEWKEEVKAEAENNGYVTTPLGARRHLRSALMSDEWGVADKALRQGPNFKIQGASAEQTKLAMARLWKSGVLFSLDMVFFAPIHDELCWSVHKDHAAESCRIINECMTVPYGDLPVPFLGSISLGPNFGDQHECGDEFDQAAIEKALETIFS